MIEVFKEIVDQSKSTVGTKRGLEDLYDHYQFIPKHHWTRSLNEISDQIYDRIKQMLFVDDPNEILTRHDLLKIQNFFVLSYFYSSLEKDPYYNIVNKLIYISQGSDKYTSFSRIEDWKTAVSLLRDLIILTGMNGIDDDFFESYYNKELEIVSAGKYFKAKGYTLDLTIEGLALDGISKKRWVKSINNDLSKIGGENFLQALFTLLKPSFDHNFNRYLIYREIGDPNTPTKPAIPFGYLLNLGIQHVGKQAEIEDWLPVFNNIIDEAKMFITLCDIQPYHFTDGLFNRPENLLDSITSSILYDNVYLFRQMNFNYLSFLLPIIFDFVDENEFEDKHGFSKNHCIEIIKQIETFPINTNITINPSILLPLVDKNLFIKIMNALSIESNRVNIGYEFPSDYSITTTQDYPLIKTELGYYLADKSWCASAFFTRFASLCANVYKKPKVFYQRLGQEVEIAIAAKFNECGIPFKKGKYAIRTDEEAECDFVIEDDTRVVFIETKNKPLTKKSKSGGQVEILNDLLSSFVSEMEQTARHRVYLQKYGHIKFNDGTELHLNGRSIERVGIALEEFGSIQSRATVLDLLRNLYISRISLDDDVETKKAIIDTLQKFKSSTLKIFDSDNEYSRRQFLDCHFFSLSMLFIMLEHSNTSKELIDELMAFKYISYSSKDFYIDYKIRWASK